MELAAGGWADFTWDAGKLTQAEAMFAESAGVLVGTVRHLSHSDQDVLTIDVMSTEAVDTSAIEGERLDPGRRASSYGDT